MFNYFLLACFLSFTIQRRAAHTASGAETIESICSNLQTANLNFLSTDDHLLSYFELPFNESHKEVVYQQTSTLDLNFDLSPRRILIGHRNVKTVFIRKEEHLTAFYDSHRLHLLNSSNEDCSNGPLLGCLVRSHDYCRFADSPHTSSHKSSFSSSANLSSKSLLTISTEAPASFHFPISKSLFCLKGNQLYHYEPTRRTHILSSYPNKLSGLALARIRNSNQSHWLVFGGGFNGLSQLHPHGTDQNEADQKKVDQNEAERPTSGLGQPNSIYFGCSQPFCVKATFDDIVYNTATNQLIIYRGRYFYEVPV